MPTSLGSGIFAHLAAGTFPTIEAAQQAMCLPHRTFFPDAHAAAIYDRLFQLYSDVYFALGTVDAEPVSLGAVLPELKRIAAEA